jgi:hypothetical protein
MTLASYEAMVRNFPIAIVTQEHKYMRAPGAIAYQSEQRRVA